MDGIQSAVRCGYITPECVGDRPCERVVCMLCSGFSRVLHACTPLGRLCVWRNGLEVWEGVFVKIVRSSGTES